ncbi:MAG: 5-methylcytosine-specific restriction endonuclease system specificity protein McrC, partial [Synergistaceae bacterium]|nr:5-methylcytosine-specific restriction endonuclease system specificity protein McrC [Synergistaceae bacterium]
MNSYFNRIINSTVLLLLKADTSSKRKKELRRLLAFFSGVDSADLHTVNWNICYNRNNQTYRMLISICFLAVK